MSVSLRIVDCGIPLLLWLYGEGHYAGGCGSDDTVPLGIFLEFTSNVSIGLRTYFR